jgi:flagellar assembly protein FliH
MQNFNVFSSWEYPELISQTKKIIHSDSEKKIDRKEEKDLNSILKETYDKAYAQGIEKGLKQAEEKYHEFFKQEWDEKINEINFLIEALREPLTVIDTEIENKMVNMVLLIVKFLFRNQCCVSSEPIITIIKESLALFPKNVTDIQIYLNVEDEKMLHTILTDRDAELADKFIVDKQLNRGDCKVVSNSTQIDARLETRLNCIIEQAFHHD